MNASRSETGASRLAAGVLGRDRASIARAITLVERAEEGAAGLLHAIAGSLGRAHRVGITGPPGAGKSTLLGALAHAIAKRGKGVGVLAVDPSSRYTHGAVLGDRVRMAELDRSEGIFIRSMATRGQGGGLGPSTDAAADILDAAGYEWLFIESAGVGQVELDIRNLVDATVVMLVPESGDEIQAIKAGLMEIADVYVVNKCDRPAASAMVSAMQACVAQQHHPDPDWMPRVLGATSISGEGAPEILAELERHRAFLAEQGRLESRRREGLKARLLRRIGMEAAARLQTDLPAAVLEAALQRVQAGRESLQDAAAQCLAAWKSGK